MKNIINLVNQYGKVVIDMNDITVNCTTDNSYASCVNQLVNAGLIIHSVDIMDGVTTFIANDALIQINAPYGDDI